MKSSSRTVIYAAMVLLLGVIALAASLKAPPIYLAVGLIGEIILGATAHLSTMIERYGIPRAGQEQGHPSA